MRSEVYRYDGASGASGNCLRRYCHAPVCYRVSGVTGAVKVFVTLCDVVYAADVPFPRAVRITGYSVFGLLCSVHALTLFFLFSSC